MSMRGYAVQQAAKDLATTTYKYVVWERFLKVIPIDPTLLEGLSPEVCKAKRVRNSRRHKYEDHTYTVNPANIYTANFDRIITDILAGRDAENPLLGTYFAADDGVYSAGIVPAYTLAKLMENLPWRSYAAGGNIIANTEEPGVRFKTISFEEAARILHPHQEIPCLYWSSANGILYISEGMRKANSKVYFA